MSKARFSGIRLAVLVVAAVGTLRAQNVEGGRGVDEVDTARVTFGGNFVLDPCRTCKYNPAPSGYAVWGPDNCEEPGKTQWEAVPFIAAASGVVDRISTSIILDSAECPENKVTLSVYTDACSPTGPGQLLGSGEATVAPSSCDLTVAKLSNGPSLIQGTKYWVTATTNSTEADLDARWYASNNAQEAYNFGDGWQLSNGVGPAFMVQGHVTGATMEKGMSAGNERKPFASNLIVDPCTGCNYDSTEGGFDVRGPDNCTSPGSITWQAVPFVASRSGVPQRILAAIILNKPSICPQDKVTLSIYTDNCEEGPGTLLVSGEATAQLTPCDIAVAKLRRAPSLTRGTKYWITATTSPEQSALDASWLASNDAQIALADTFGWFQFTSATPAFEVQ